MPEEQVRCDGWEIDHLISLLDSTREEVRAHRAQLYGAVAAAFLLPLATIATQATHFLYDFNGVWGWSAFSLWVLGLFVMTGGLWRISPKRVPRGIGASKSITEPQIVTATQDALRGSKEENKEHLARCIDAQCDILRSLFNASRLFNLALGMFFIAAGLEFLGFVLCIVRDGPNPS